MDAIRLLDYDLWATRQVLTQVGGLSDAQFVQEFAGPLSSVRQQAVHMVTVPDRYRARIMGEPVPDASPESFASPRELLLYSEAVAGRMVAMAESLTPTRLAKTVRHETRGGLFIMTVEKTILHVINHGTFHRGQIAYLLKLHGVDPVDTDFVLWPDISAVG